MQLFKHHSIFEGKSPWWNTWWSAGPADSRLTMVEKADVFIWKSHWVYCLWGGWPWLTAGTRKSINLQNYDSAGSKEGRAAVLSNCGHELPCLAHFPYMALSRWILTSNKHLHLLTFVSAEASNKKRRNSGAQKKLLKAADPDPQHQPPLSQKIVDQRPLATTELKQGVPLPSWKCSGK